jgi:hypothetical protein
VSRFNPERFRLTLGVDSLTLMTRTRLTPWRISATSSYNAQITSTAFQPGLQQLLAAHVPRGREVSAVIDDRLVRYFIVTPPDRLNSFADLRTITALRFSTLFGDKAADWEMQAEWAAGRPFLVCALPRALRATVLSELKAGGWQSGGMKPESVWIWNDCARRMRDPQGWFARIGAGHFLLTASNAGHVVAVSMSNGPPPEGADALRAVLMRESLRWDRPLPSKLYLSQTKSDATESLHGQRIDAVGIVLLRPDFLEQEFPA